MGVKSEVKWRMQQEHLSDLRDLGIPRALPLALLALSELAKGAQPKCPVPHRAGLRLRPEHFTSSIFPKLCVLGVLCGEVFNPHRGSVPLGGPA